MTRVVLVRHGQTIWHAENRYAGGSDIELTEVGHAQAAALGRWAAIERPTALWASPLLRTRTTAAPAAGALGLEPRLDARLREVGFGQGEGKTLAEMAAAFPEAFAAFRRDPVANPLPGGEDPRAAVRRGVECLAEIARLHPDERVLVVSHGTLMRLVICELLEIPLGRYRAVFPAAVNGALTELELREGGAGLLTYNVPLA